MRLIGAAKFSPKRGLRREWERGPDLDFGTQSMAPAELIPAGRLRGPTGRPDRFPKPPRAGWARPSHSRPARRSNASAGRLDVRGRAGMITVVRLSLLLLAAPRYWFAPVPASRVAGRTSPTAAGWPAGHGARSGPERLDRGTRRCSRRVHRLLACHLGTASTRSLSSTSRHASRATAARAAAVQVSATSPNANSRLKFATVARSEAYAASMAQAPGKLGCGGCCTAEHPAAATAITITGARGLRRLSFVRVTTLTIVAH